MLDIEIGVARSIPPASGPGREIERHGRVRISDINDITETAIGAAVEAFRAGTDHQQIRSLTADPCRRLERTTEIITKGGTDDALRTEERRLGKACGRPCRSRGWPYH